jgi:dihydroorotase
MSYTLSAPLDMHLHLREGAMLETVAPLSARDFAAAVIMPNLVPPVDTAQRLRAYRAEIARATEQLQFQPLMTLFFRNYPRELLEELRNELFAIKLYPEGVTTNSSGGVSDLRSIEPTLEVMAELGIPLLVHGESHGFVLDREREFLPVYRRLAQRFPTLTIVMEHITTADAVHLLDEFPNLAATVTLHHLLITLDDVAGGMLQPHLFCKPIAKRPEDRDALLAAALRAHPRLMFGSDSAPHPIDRKEAAGCAAGVFTAPVILPVLVELFEQHDALDRLPDFVSGNAARLHGLFPPAKQVTLERRPWQVPERYGVVVPYLAGTTLNWQVTEIR